MNPDMERAILQLALKDLPVAVAVVDPGGDVLYSNASARKALGIVEWVPGETISLGALGWSGTSRSISALLAAAAASSHWIPLRFRRDDEELVVRARGVKSDDQTQPCVLITGTPDAVAPFAEHASQVKALNRQLAIRRQAEDRLDYAMRAARIGIWELEIESDTAWRSAQHDAIFGYPDPLPAWSFALFLDHVLEEDREQVKANFERQVEAGQSWDFECRIRRPDGEVRWIAAEGSPTLDVNGKVLRLNGVVADITDRKEAEQRLAAAGRMEAVGHMAGGLAHDFANIMGIIRLSGEVARMTESAEVRRARLEAILQAAERGASLTARTLSFARREPGAVQAVNVAELVSDLLALTFASLADEIVVDSEVDSGIHVECDPGQLENVLLNLTLNAREAIESSGVGGHIRVGARPVEESGSVEIFVSDDGPGMSDAVRERAADPFFTTKADSGGSGFGLATVAAFTAAANGEFWIESRPNKGTRVSLTLPAASPAIEADVPQTSFDSDRVLSQQLLVVEDDAEYRAALYTSLTGMGFSVATAADGNEALQLLEDGADVDVLITDVLLPGELNGFHVAAKARSLRPELPVVYMSGYADAAGHDGAPRGAFLRKPVGQDEIRHAIAQAVQAN